MNRKPVTVADDYGLLIEGAIESEEFDTRSEVVRTALREYFASHEVLLAVLLADIDDVAVRDVVTTVGADPDTVSTILSHLGEGVEAEATADILSEIESSIAPMDGEDV